MLLPHKKDVIHKVWLLRLLTAIAENAYLSSRLGFKGGTCAAMRGFLNRFSVDLDFDLLIEENETGNVRNALEKCFKDLGLVIKDKSTKVPQYFLRYPDSKGRNTIKVDALFPVPKKNKYEMVCLPEIDRTLKCQTVETIVSNKFITLIARYERTGKIAGRDVFDVHHFLFNGYPYSEEIIFEQRKESPSNFFKQLMDFVDKKITNTIIDQDLNHLLPNSEFQSIRKILKQETLMLLRSELGET
ncbi:MAG: nucleotidyl transferase AbiEii/AbiGii toxin family protein [Candidatus Gracilibacteria bacterium]|jgi:predicted nucleotidyltransferase component of viral defense system